MGSFGWAYVNCTGAVGEVGGPIKSVQYLKNATTATGSSMFLFHETASGPYAAKTLVLTGTLVISGTISASHYHIEDVTRIDSSGSTYFGNTNDDIHSRTGSLIVADQSTNVIFTSDPNTHQTYIKALKLEYTQITTTNQTASIATGLIGVGGTGHLTVRLPNAATAGAGSILTFKDEVSNASRGGSVHISSSAAPVQTIDGAGFTQLAGGYASVNLYSDGSNWFIF